MRCSGCGVEIRDSEQQVCPKCGKRVGGRYAVSPSSLEQPEFATSGEPPYAGFWWRAGAYIIDRLILIVAYVLLAVLVRSMAPTKQVAALAFLFYIVGAWLYHAGMESSANQGTLGKLAVGIKVTDLNGERIGFGRATGRYFANIVTALTFGIGYVTTVFTRRRQTVHDMIAETLVVDRDFSSEQIAAAGPAPRVPVALAVLSVVAIVLVGPFGLGILAAIAIPAYQNYTIRAQIAEGLNAAAPYKQAVVEAYDQGRPLRAINSRILSVATDDNLKYVDSVQVVSGVVVIKYGRTANRNIAQKSLVLAPGLDSTRNIVWICGHHSPATPLEMAVPGVGRYTTVGDQYLPSGCR
jgi:uncharacterized RDD family membrane protein YckC/Tfp pilus assembly major pilin PilA